MKILRTQFTILCTTALGLSVSTATLRAAEQENPWLLRVRAVQLEMANKSTPISGLAGSDAIHIEDKLMPEVDISYFFTPNWAAELVLTVPQKHEVTLEQNGNVSTLGSFKHLPPTLSLQYHFKPNATIQPYVGVGVNYTKFSNEKLSAGATPLSLENSSLGLAFGAGVDIPISSSMRLNLDIKKLQIRSDVLASGSKISELKADPFLLGIGLGWKF